MVVNSDGTGRISTGLRHATPATSPHHSRASRPAGLDHHENERLQRIFHPGYRRYDATTGEVIWAANPRGHRPRSRDGHRSEFPGMEVWAATGGTVAATRTTITPRRPPPTHDRLVDGDLLRELEDGTSISKWNFTSRTTQTLLSTSGNASNTVTKSNPCLIADMFGDCGRSSLAEI